MLQRHAIQKLHGNKRLPIFFANVMNRADIRMVQRRCRLRLPLKPAERLRVPRHIIRKEFQSNKASQPRVLGLEYHAHAATTYLLHNPVVRNGLPNHSPQTYETYRTKSMNRRACGADTPVRPTPSRQSQKPIKPALSHR